MGERGERKGTRTGFANGILGGYGLDIFEEGPVSRGYQLGKLLSPGPFKFLALLDEVDESAEDEDCFVASTVYGSRENPKVRELREIRDNVLMKSELGRAFVDFYYSGAGKRAARFIREEAPFLVGPIRTALDGLVALYPEKGAYYARPVA